MSNEHSIEHYQAVERGRSENLLAHLTQKLGRQLLDSKIELGDLVVEIQRAEMVAFFQLLKLDSDLAFDLFVSVTAVDWMDQRSERFEMVYHLMSTKHLHRLRILIKVPEKDPSVNSLVQLWNGADFMEREVWDMYGIKFAGHPDLRRTLMYEEFVGHPLRKDYPLQAKQPRVRLREPEVRNTALDMIRPELVQIGSKHSGNSGKKNAPVAVSLPGEL